MERKSSKEIVNYSVKIKRKNYIFHIFYRTKKHPVKSCFLKLNYVTKKCHDIT